MLLGGLWHGANWTFVIWGAYHGVLLIGHKLIGDRLSFAPLLLRRWSTFVLVVIGWVVFRSTDLSMAATWLFRMFDVTSLGHAFQGLGTDFLPKKLVVLVMLCFLAVNLLPETWDIQFGRRRTWVLAYGVAIFAGLLFMGRGTSPFLYYQF